ncbi:transmembrane amino acid transporter protein-domain-containing protein [Clohesyomyces aquaticus]|uniref:Transmembrane amino acid transporter protein-domain-containing protein n=1 Tax=Clohesyomyces aquaticus TaxID=1231657 RepID=A0A1Y1ZVU6_9PLEO|nr:transmembrane amino acid transporter protein-domain-containing protein [Clohesyomyces aquaticus]
MIDEKKEIQAAPRASYSAGEVEDAVFDPKASNDDFEVFKKTTDGVDFRLVGWVRASVIFLKDFAIVQGNFRNSHAHCHSIADMANVVGGPVLREICGALFIAAYVLCTGSGIVGLATALNALSDHAVCTVWWAFLSACVIVACASVRKFQKIGWLTWAGFISVYIAVFIVVVGVTTRDRPAAAPQEGPFDLGYHVIAYPTFIVGMTASCTIFVSSAGTSAFLPVISEMRNPKDYNKAVYVCMAIVQASYLTFSLVVYKWCGKWVTNPSLGSAGPTVKKVAYGIGLIGLAVSGCLYLHVAAKYIFVRILRNSRHLQQNTLVHWGTWFSCTIILGALAFILAEAIPIFSYLIALTGSICFAPLAICLPGWLWLHDHWAYRKRNAWQMFQWYGHWLLIAIGMFTCVGGTYGVVMAIKTAYANGMIGGAFSCADNSNTHG